ncbi:FixH family protein [Oceanobacillus sp. J11TS1]|uniref:FixH family protein n=1 Tax=Oceanobacillus sp. J11TS1 TaxID=2807191 RepID=UPI001B016D73|nr:FixH family protein [Oceanobacillus sp. J11TS1]GIO22834.1 hypothetical protein J11TS1_14150 [Oceanobacillus sp. J11TS1]
MKNKLLMFLFVIIVGVLAACNNGTEEEQDESEELKMLEVEFNLPEKADVGETIELLAIVTYGDEKVTDADEVEFEYWEKGKEEDSTFIEGNNNGDGTYTAEVSFDKDGVYEIYAHTTAKSLHTMPKKSITVGTGESNAEAENQDDESEGHDHESHEHNHHADGFELHFVKPENVDTDTETELIVHLQMDGNPLEEANVRYEIWNDDLSDKHEWVNAEEVAPGEYTGTHQFTEAGTYNIQVHVENDDGLHEHKEYEVLVNG